MFVGYPAPLHLTPFCFRLGGRVMPRFRVGIARIGWIAFATKLLDRASAAFEGVDS
jgi:hypothetical protein